MLLEVDLIVALWVHEEGRDVPIQHSWAVQFDLSLLDRLNLGSLEAANQVAMNLERELGPGRMIVLLLLSGIFMEGEAGLGQTALLSGEEIGILDHLSMHLSIKVFGF